MSFSQLFLSDFRSSILRASFSRFIWGDHGWVPCASLWMIVTSQMLRITVDLRFSGWTRALGVHPWDLLFLSFWGVRGHKFLGIASLGTLPFFIYLAAIHQVVWEIRWREDRCWPATCSFFALYVFDGLSIRSIQTVCELLVCQCSWLFVGTWCLICESTLV
jgi:hypothetical protein